MKQISWCKVLLLCAFLLPSMIAEAQDGKFQAIFLYKFIENINWPDAKKALVIGMIGETEVQREFEKMLKARGNNSLTVKQITVSEASACDVVFLPQSQNYSFNALLEKTVGKSILIVTEASNLARSGAGISFLKDGNKLTFGINKQSLDARSLKVSNALLVLSKEI
jgi:hypothetical protein